MPKTDRQVNVTWKKDETDYETVRDLVAKSQWNATQAQVVKTLLHERLELLESGWSGRDDKFLVLFGSILQLNDKAIEEVRALVGKFASDSSDPRIVKPPGRKRKNIG